ncbi:DNA-directed RNA polymerase subunit alpha C-terminal domain-containing protein [Streptosporangium amethystogenes]|uniref:WD40 repeat domain-containing protein n=1 Tax=Streptosporangium amethystogenes TaxID=2002 RepID=UPI0037A14C98
MSLRRSWATGEEPLCSSYHVVNDAWLWGIEELNLTVRFYNRLKRAGIHTCGELTDRREQDLLAIEGINSTMVEEARQKLADIDLSLRPSSAGPKRGIAREHIPFTQRSLSPSVRAVAFHPDGHLLATAGMDDAAQLWDTATDRPVGALPDHVEAADTSAPRFSDHLPDSDHTRQQDTGAGCTARLWDTATGRPVGTSLTGHTDTVWSVAFHPDGHLLATAGSDDAARLWDTATGRPVGAPLSGHIRCVYAVAFHPEGHLLVTAGWDCGLRLWEISTGRLIALFTGHTAAVYTAAFHPDGIYLITAGEDGTVRLWDPRGDGQSSIVHTPGHTGAVYAVTFHPDGHLLATAGEDGTVRLWRFGNPVTAPLTAHTGSVWSVAFHPSAPLLASAGEDGTVRLWDIPASHR